MATVAIFTLKGLAGCQENLDRLSRELQQKLIAKALRAAMVPVAKRVKETTYGPGRKRVSGMLAAGQGAFAKVQPNLVFAGLVAIRVPNRKPILRLQSAMTNKQRRTKAGTSPFYWWFLERGTKRVSARPWVGPALDATSLQALDAFAGKLSSDLDDACAKLPKTI